LIEITHRQQRIPELEHGHARHSGDRHGRPPELKTKQARRGGLHFSIADRNNWAADGFII
jgi:hypothetical protein